MTDLRKAAEMALEALDYEAEEEPDSIWKEERDALRQALKTEREWVGLTDEEINSVCYRRDWTAPWTDTTFARAIEAKLREKNGGEYRNGATTERTKLNQENT